MKYTNLENLKKFLSITENNYDLSLEDIILRATNMINFAIGGTLESKKIIERVNGNGTKKIYLKNKANKILKITGKDKKDYKLDFFEGYIIFLEKIAEKGQKNIIVEYEFGFEETPKEIEEICLDLCAILSTENNILGKNSENIVDKNIKTKKLGELMITYFGETEKKYLSSKDILNPSKNIEKILNKYKPFVGVF